jgi:hypothetical protein
LCLSAIDNVLDLDHTAAAETKRLAKIAQNQI